MDHPTIKDEVVTGSNKRKFNKCKKFRKLASKLAYYFSFLNLLNPLALIALFSIILRASNSLTPEMLVFYDPV